MKLFLVNQAREAVSQIYKDFGLTQQTPAKPSDIQIFSLSRPSPIYTMNVANIHTHLQAEITNVAATSDSFSYVLNKVPVTTVFECPPLRLVFTALTAGERDTLLQFGLTADTGNVYSGQLPVSAVSEIVKMKPQSETYRAGTVDWDGYIARTLIMQLLTFFSNASASFTAPLSIILPDSYSDADATNDLIVKKTELYSLHS